MLQRMAALKTAVIPAFLRTSSNRNDKGGSVGSVLGRTWGILFPQSEKSDDGHRFFGEQ